MQKKYMTITKRAYFVKMASYFYTKWNFQNCAGPLDGKHFTIKQPVKSGIMYRNYKGKYSNVLSVTDANYKYVYVDVGVQGE
jgi:hypothetical protein